jgi:hypothetical protein
VSPGHHLPDSPNGQPMPFDLMNTLGNGIPLLSGPRCRPADVQPLARLLCAAIGGCGLGLAQLRSGTSTRHRRAGVVCGPRARGRQLPVTRAAGHAPTRAF